MSVWLPRRPPGLLARQVLHVRSSARQQAHVLPRFTAYRALNTTSPNQATPDASASNHATSSHSSNGAAHANATVSTNASVDGPTAEPKNLPPSGSKEVSTAKAPLGTRVWKTVKHAVQHYWHGSKLLVREVRISTRLQWKLLHGENLTRRERRQVWFPIDLGRAY
jgi:LETM1 and EF-hand domain-containing protein 1, mitochondrial